MSDIAALVIIGWPEIHGAHGQWSPNGRIFMLGPEEKTLCGLPLHRGVDGYLAQSEITCVLCKLAADGGLPSFTAELEEVGAF